MKCYPIKEQYAQMFYHREKALLSLIRKESMQLHVITERIDACDFSMRCIRFYKSSEYELKNNTIVYTNEITKEKIYCCIHNNHLSLTSTKGFESFLKRYFKICFLIKDEEDAGLWFSYEKNEKNHKK